MPKEASERRIAYQDNLEQGFCPRCGVKKKKKETHSYCEDCREYFRNYNQEIAETQNENRKMKYSLRKQNNQCPRCGKKLGKRYKNTICTTCLEKQYQYNYGPKNKKKTKK